MRTAADISPRVEKDIEEAIVTARYANNATFEELCCSILRRIPQYATIQSTRKTPGGDSPPSEPDAIAKTKAGEVWFEFTATDRAHLTSYVKALSNRQYLRKNKTIRLILVSSQLMGKTLRSKLEGILSSGGLDATVLACGDLVGMLRAYAADLIESLLGVAYRPRLFSTLEETCDGLEQSRIDFPPRRDFVAAKLSIPRETVDAIVDHLAGRNGALLMGQWGTGKTVIAIAAGFALRKQLGVTPFYLDLLMYMDKGDRQIASAIRSAIDRFGGACCSLIIDNAHIRPALSYSASKMLRESRIGLLLVSRPISKDVTGFNAYYPDLFMDTYEKGRSNSVEGSEPYVTFNPPQRLEVWMAILESRCTQLTLEKRVGREEATSLFEDCGGNLVLLKMLLERWDPAKGPLNAVPRGSIYEELHHRLNLLEYPEIYTIAALNSLDCPADVNVVFRSPGRVQAFRENFVRSTGRSVGHLQMRRGLVFGLNAAEARLVCDAGLSTLAPPLQDLELERGTPSIEAIRRLLLGYVRKRPRNPYQVLRSIWNSLSESASNNQTGEADLLLDLASSVLRDHDFQVFLRNKVFLSAPSMAALGNAARLSALVSLTREEYQSLVGEEVIREFVMRNQKQQKERFPTRMLRFTWREFFAWRKLSSLEENLGLAFLSCYPDDTIISFGLGSLKRVADICLIARKTPWVRLELEKRLDSIKLVGWSQENLCRLSQPEICFLLRDFVACGEAFRRALMQLVPPEALANVVERSGVSEGGRIFAAARRHIGHDYARRMFDAVGPEKAYALAFDVPLGRINSELSSVLFRRFVKNDLPGRFLEATPKDVTLFLRSVRRHGFSVTGKALVGSQLLRKDVIDGLVEKFVEFSIEDLGFLLMSILELSWIAFDAYIHRLDECTLRLKESDSLRGFVLICLCKWIGGCDDLWKNSSFLGSRILLDGKVRVASLHEAVGLAGLDSLVMNGTTVVLREDQLRRVSDYVRRMTMRTEYRLT